MICAKFDLNWLNGSGEDDFLILSQFHYYLPLEKVLALHLKKFESPSPKDALCHFGLNWPSGSREEDKM